jgi:hypothetical protein
MPINNEQILSMEPTKLQDWLDKEFELTKPIPAEISTVEDMQTAEKMIAKLTNRLSYLSSLGVYAKFAVRSSKRKGKEFKTEWEDMVDRQTAINTAENTIRQQYTALSRMITVKQEINKEIYMSENIINKLS